MLEREGKKPLPASKFFLQYYLVADWLQQDKHSRNISGARGFENPGNIELYS